MRDLQKYQRFKIVSLGCRTNQYEAQALRDQLLALGLEPARENEHADLCIVNTCTVTESADAKSENVIRKLAKKHPGAKLAVTGCSVERQPDKIKSIEGVTHLVPNANKEILLGFFKRCRPLSHPSQVPELVSKLVEAVEANPETAKG